MKHFFGKMKDESGAALMMAVFTVTVLMVIATEVMYDTSVELSVSSQSVNAVKAHYAAKSGVEISLLRIHLFRKASEMVGKAGPAAAAVKPMLNMIWQVPFAWPPVVPEGTSGVDKGEIQSAIKASGMEGQYIATIESESGKIDLNDLDSPSDVVKESVKKQLLEIFTGKMENDEDFSSQLRGFDFNALVNNIQDWVDADKVSGQGGPESALYSELDVGESLPPNAPFKTIQELHMVAGMTDELFEILAPRVTTYGTKGINPNIAEKDVLMSLSSQITAEFADKIIEDRASQAGPFTDRDNFVSRINAIGVRGDPFKNEQGQETVPLIFDSEFNFRIRSTGQSGKVIRDITAIVFDYEQAKARLKSLMPTPPPTPAAGPGGLNPPPVGTVPTPTPTPAAGPPPVPNERPNIVYWNET